MTKHILQDALFPSFKRHRMNEAGAVLAELALVIPWLALFVVYATDYTLERLAEAQVQAATIAAAEFAQVKGCDYEGIRSAATNALLSGFPQLTANPEVSTTPTCQCPFLNTTETYGDYNSVTGCSATCGESGENAEPFVNIGIEAAYSPLFPMQWIGAGRQTITDSAMVRTKLIGGQTCTSGARG